MSDQCAEAHAVDKDGSQLSTMGMNPTPAALGQLDGAIARLEFLSVYAGDGMPNRRRTP